MEISSASVIVCSFLWRISGKREAPALRNAPAGTAKGDIALGKKQNVKERGPYYKTEREKDLWFPLRSVQAESLHLVSIVPQRPVLLKGLHVSSVPGTARGWLRQFEKNRVIGDTALQRTGQHGGVKQKILCPLAGGTPCYAPGAGLGETGTSRSKIRHLFQTVIFCNDLCEKNKFLLLPERDTELIIRKTTAEKNDEKRELA